MFERKEHENNTINECTICSQNKWDDKAWFMKFLAFLIYLVDQIKVIHITAKDLACVCVMRTFNTD